MKTVRLKGKTLRGKNRIDRGGEFWRVTQMSGKTSDPPGVQRWLVQSLRVGQREMFWIDRPTDQHVEVVADTTEGTG